MCPCAVLVIVYKTVLHSMTCFHFGDPQDHEALCIVLTFLLLQAEFIKAFRRITKIGGRGSNQNRVVPDAYFFSGFLSVGKPGVAKGCRKHARKETSSADTIIETEKNRREFQI